MAHHHHKKSHHGKVGKFFKKVLNPFPLKKPVQKLIHGHKKHHAKQHAPGKKIGHGKDKGKGTEAFKLEQGKKYSRLQRFPTLSKDQQNILKEFQKKPSKEKFHRPKIHEEATHLLRSALKKGIPGSPVEMAGQNFLQNLLSRTPEQQLQNFEEPYLRQFREQTVPEIAERFTGQDAQRSSAFAQTMGQAGAGLSENLASIKGNLINQLLGQQLQGANVGLGYSQLPGQRFTQQMQAAQIGVPMSLIPQQAQQEMNRFATNQRYQQLQQVLGTQPWGMLAVPPRGKAPSFWQGMAPRAIGGLAGAAIGSIVPGIGTAVGAGLGMSLAGGAPPAIQAPGVQAAPQRIMGPVTNNL